MEKPLQKELLCLKSKKKMSQTKDNRASNNRLTFCAGKSIIQVQVHGLVFGTGALLMDGVLKHCSDLQNYHFLPCFLSGPIYTIANTQRIRIYPGKLEFSLDKISSDSKRLHCKRTKV